MEALKKYKWAFFPIVVALVTVFALLYRFHDHDTRTIKGFAAAYEEYDRAIHDFSAGIRTSDVAGDSAISQLDTVFNHITMPTQDPAPDDIRLALAKWAIGTNDSLMRLLSGTDGAEQVAGDMLANLEAKAAVRLSSFVEHDAEIMSNNGRIFDLSARELETVKAYKSTVAEKRATQEKLLKVIVDENGGLVNFRLMSDDQSQLQNENAELETLVKEIRDLRAQRANAFARFESLTRLTDKIEH